MHMKKEDVLYTDGHDVVVTYSAIQVKKKWYKLNGITRHGLSILGPEQLPFVVLLVLGTALALTGLFEGAASVVGLTEYSVLDFTVNLNQVFFWAGVSVLALTAALMLVIPERYAVSITTAEGEKNLVVSTQREYVTQILKALNEAFLARVSSQAGLVKKSRKKQQAVASA
jgi:hypothetical protein